MSPTVYSPPVPTYTALATFTATGGETSVTFSSIPASYRDLIMVVDGTANINTSLNMRFNSDSGSNYSYVYAYGDGSTNTLSGAASGTSIVQVFLFSNPTNNIIQIMDYSATDKHKTVLSRWNTPANSLQMSAERWANTDAINTITLAFGSGRTPNSGSTFSLYGIEA